MKLFEPLELRSGLKLRNRIVMPAMHLNFTPTGEVTDELVQFYCLRAAGGVGLIIVGGCTVAKDAGGEFMIGINHDRFVDGLRRLVESVHAEGAKIAVQLYHAGRYTHSFLIGGKRAPSASDTYSPLTRERSREMTKQEIEEVLQEFYQAAQRATRAGFDAVEMLASAGYLVSQFLSPLTNHRTDEYGGTLKNRMRFGVEVLEAIKEGSGLPVLVRLSGYDFVQGSTPQAEIVEFAKTLAEHGAELFNITGGWHESRVPQITYHLPPAGMAHLGVLYKRALEGKAAVSIANRVYTPELAETLLRRGVCDAVAMGRPLLVDPQFPRKAQEGRTDEILPCIACNQECLDKIFSLQRVGCSVNPLVGEPDEAEFLNRKTEHPRKVLVVGGGPAGLAAAWLLASTGHTVELYEREPRFGGTVNTIARVPHKSGFASFVAPLARLAELAGAQLHTGVEVTPELVNERSPDLVVLATGAEPARPPIEGIELDHVVFAHDLIANDLPAGRRVVVIGGGAVGVEAAITLAARAAMSPEALYHFMLFDAYNPLELQRLLKLSPHEITLVEMLPRIGEGIGKSTKWAQKLLLSFFGVQVLTKTKVLRITKDAVEAEHNGERLELAADTVVIATGITPRTNLADALNAAGFAVEVIGDAAGTGDIPAATKAALGLARKLLG